MSPRTLKLSPRPDDARALRKYPDVDPEGRANVLNILTGAVLLSRGDPLAAVAEGLGLLPKDQRELADAVLSASLEHVGGEGLTYPDDVPADKAKGFLSWVVNELEGWPPLPTGIDRFGPTAEDEDPEATHADYLIKARKEDPDLFL